jgi:hypothetical protein
MDRPKLGLGVKKNNGIAEREGSVVEAADEVDIGREIWGTRIWKKRASSNRRYKYWAKERMRMGRDGNVQIS